jgi:hypothetical protein
MNGDRQGMPVSNGYQAYNTDGTTDPASSFAYWTDPVSDIASKPSPGHDTNPNMVYSPTPPATTFPKPKPDTITPAPWVSFTRAGCDVGGVSTANIELENTSVDIPKVFGPHSPEAKQLAADKDPFKDPEVGGLQRCRGALRPGSPGRVLARGQGGQVRPDQADAHRGARRAAR